MYELNDQVFIIVGMGSTAEYWPGVVTSVNDDGTYDVEPFEEDRDNPYYPWGSWSADRLKPL